MPPEKRLPGALPPVLLIVDALHNNGAVQITVGLARRWADSGSRLAVLIQPPGPVQEVPGATVDHMTSPGTRMRYGVILSVPRLIRSARRCDAVVNGSEIGLGLLLGFVAARLTGRPFVIGVHADLDDALAEWVPSRMHRLFRWVHRHADSAICVSNGVVPPILRNGLPPDRVRVVRNGIDTAAVQQAARQPGHLADTELPTVIATGRLAEQKGYDLLLRAHAEVVSQHPHRLALVNDGPEAGNLEALATELGVQGSVIFAGVVDGPLPDVARAALFCLPSRHEGLPLALLEAVSLGVPIIATDCSPGVREALDDGRVGELVPVEDVDALAAALARHLADPSELRRRATFGPEHARSFDIGVMADGWAAEIYDVIERSRRHGRRRTTIS